MFRSASEPGSRAKGARLVILGLASVFGVLFAAAIIDPGPVIEAFWEERAEQRYLGIWQRQASDVTWQECRTQPDLCPGKFVVWEVQRPVRGVTCYEGNCSQLVAWTNESQVPVTHSSNMRVVGRVVRAEPGSVVLTFLGSPQAPYGGTTRPRDIGVRIFPASLFDPRSAAKLKGETKDGSRGLPPGVREGKSIVVPGF